MHRGGLREVRSKKSISYPYIYIRSRVFLIDLLSIIFITFPIDSFAILRSKRSFDELKNKTSNFTKKKYIHHANFSHFIFFFFTNLSTHPAQVERKYRITRRCNLCKYVSILVRFILVNVKYLSSVSRNFMYI